MPLLRCCVRKEEVDDREGRWYGDQWVCDVCDAAYGEGAKCDT